MRQQVKMTIAGYLSRDPQLAVTQGGDKVLGLSVPYTPQRFDQGRQEWVKVGETLWVKAALWNEDAELYSDKLAKGTAVIVEGEPVLRMWEKDGRSGAELELKFARVSIVPTAPKQQSPAQSFPAHESEPWAPGSAAFSDQTPF